VGTEGLGYVIFVPSADVVLLHRERAQHIAEALVGGLDLLVLEDARLRWCWCYEVGG
jgi:hypothetical protein